MLAVISENISKLAPSRRLLIAELCNRSLSDEWERNHFFGSIDRYLDDRTKLHLMVARGTGTALAASMTGKLGAYYGGLNFAACEEMLRLYCSDLEVIFPGEPESADVARQILEEMRQGCTLC